MYLNTLLKTHNKPVLFFPLFVCQLSQDAFPFTFSFAPSFILRTLYGTILRAEVRLVIKPKTLIYSL
jgi:hypothetical protein